MTNKIEVVKERLTKRGAKVLDIFLASHNSNKKYVITRYPNGTYYVNEFIHGQVFYKRNVRVSKSYVMNCMW